MKKLVSVLVVLFVVAFAVPSIACAWGDGGNAVAYGGNANSNATGVGIGQGGSAVIEKGAVKNTNKNTNLNANINSNRNLNCNSNRNTNVNRNSNRQGQAQGQLQGQVQAQGQLQGQSQSANNEGNHQTLVLEQTETETRDVIIQEVKRDHIQGPGIVTPDPKFQMNRAYKAKTQGAASFMTHVETLTWKQAKRVSDGMSDVEVKESVLFEKDFMTDRVHMNKKASGSYMGTLYLGSAGDDVTAVGMIGVAAKRAMKLGATGMKVIFISAGVTADASSWNIGIGGGASIMQSGDDIAIAPNGGLGYGKAKSLNEARPEMVVEIYFDAELIKK